MKTTPYLEILMISKLVMVNCWYFRTMVAKRHAVIAQKKRINSDVKFVHKLMTFPLHCSYKLQLLNHTLIGYQRYFTLIREILAHAHPSKALNHNV